MTVQELINALQRYWSERGCVILPPYDMEVGAGTFTPPTFLRSLSKEPISVAYVAPSRRPTDGRYGENPNRLYKFHQFQVLLKPSPIDNQELYLGSLKAIGLDLTEHDIRFVHDDWESPTLGAYGLGWEVWIDGMEATQFTYFQTVGQFKVDPVSVEYAYGIERLAMYVQNVDNVYDLKWNETTTYGELFLSDEREWGKYHFERANSSMWKEHFDAFEKEASSLLSEGLIQPPLDFVMKASHAFNTLDARGAISVSERAGYIARLRHLSHSLAKNYLAAHPPKERVEEPQVLKLAQVPTLEKPAPFLLEIGSEELPASFIPKALTSLQKLFEELCESEHISYEKIALYGAPRRLSLLADNLSPMSAPPTEERRGPTIEAAFNPDGTLARAGMGFFSSCKLDPLSREEAEKHPAISFQEIKNKTYLFATVASEPKSTCAILAEKLPKLISKIAFPKKMRWNNFSCEYARPMHWIVALFGKEVVPFEFGPVISGRTSKAHRQRKNNAPIELKEAGLYVEMLRQNDVLVCPLERRAKIEELLQPYHPAHIESLLSEVTHLVEWPDICIGSFDKAFLQIPHEVLVCEMEEHQKVFPLLEKDELSNQFAIICDQVSSDQIRSGNERVISARLSDGRFLYNQDLGRSLDAMLEGLKKMTFYEGLGTMYEKSLRLEKHILALHDQLGIGSAEELVESAKYAKADLTSHLVGEFPELQGIAGSKYAKAMGKEAIAQAIAEHWLPTSEGGPLPKTPEGSLLGLADKLDNLLACFATGRVPTSTKDPYGLRRAAIGLLRICFENNIDLHLREAIKALSIHMPKQPTHDQIEALISFILGRMEALFIHEGFTKTEIAATIPSPQIGLCDLLKRLHAVHALKESADFAALNEVFKRASGQVKGIELPAFNTDLVQEPEEIELEKALGLAESRFESSCDAGDYRAALEALVGLKEPLHLFFDAVRVQCDESDIRGNRLAMLGRILAMSRQLAHIQEI